MNANELTVLITMGLLGAVLMGWILRWVYGSFAAARMTSVDTIDSLTRRTEEAEETRAAAERRALDIEERMQAQMREKQAEIDAAMDGLRSAREEIAAWRNAYEDLERRAQED